MKRIESLDALRGIAAAIVLFHHCAITVPGLREWVQATIVLRPLVAGPSAVLVFFVLSGFVLYLALDGRDRFRYLPYLAKRITRIYPPLVAAILLSVLLYTIAQPTQIPSLSDWFNVLSWGGPPSAEVIAGHLLLLDGTDYQGFNNVIWSLVHEMRILFFFPILAMCVRRSTIATLAVTALVSLGSMMMAEPIAQTTLVDPYATLQYLVLFAAGAALAKHGDAIRRIASGRHSLWIGPMLLSIGVVSGLMIQRSAALGAVCLVAACFAWRPLADVLSHRALTWLGKISYSLYLTHLLVLLTMVHTLHDVLDMPVILAMVPIVSLAVATFSHRWVEIPSIALGRRIAASRRQPPPEVDSSARIASITTRAGREKAS